MKLSLAIPHAGACVAGLVVALALALPSRCPLDVTFVRWSASRQTNKPRPNSISGNIELTIQLASALTQVLLKTAGKPFVPTRSRFMHPALKVPPARFAGALLRCSAGVANSNVVYTRAARSFLT